MSKCWSNYTNFFKSSEYAVERDSFCLHDCLLFQVAELQAEVDNLQVKFTSLSRQTKLTQDEKDVEVFKVFCLFV